MAPESPDYEKLEPIPHRYAYSGIILTVIIFQLINRVVVKVGLPETVDARDTWKWRNLFISWIHAVIVGIWDLLCFAKYHPQMIDDPIDYHNHYLDAMLIFSTGYFIHDFLDIWLNSQTVEQWEVTLHHVMGVSVFGYNILSSRCIPYNAVVLLAEVNSIFLHARKLLQMRKVPFTSLQYRIIAWVNLFTFFFFRMIPMVTTWQGMYSFSDRLHWIHIWMLYASIFVISVINMVLFYRLLKNDLYKPLVASFGRKKEHQNGGNLYYTNNNSNNGKMINGTKEKLK